MRARPQVLFLALVLAAPARAGRPYDLGDLSKFPGESPAKGIRVARVLSADGIVLRVSTHEPNTPRQGFSARAETVMVALTDQFIRLHDAAGVKYKQKVARGAFAALAPGETLAGWRTGPKQAFVCAIFVAPPGTLPSQFVKGAPGDPAGNPKPGPFRSLPARKKPAGQSAAPAGNSARLLHKGAAIRVLSLELTRPLVVPAPGRGRSFLIKLYGGLADVVGADGKSHAPEENQIYAADRGEALRIVPVPGQVYRALLVQVYR